MLRVCECLLGSGRRSNGRYGRHQEGGERDGWVTQTWQGAHTAALTQASAALTPPLKHILATMTSIPLSVPACLFPLASSFSDRRAVMAVMPVDTMGLGGEWVSPKARHAASWSDRMPASRSLADATTLPASRQATDMVGVSLG